MANCLVTKLLAVIDNPNLEKYGILTFSIPSVTSFSSGVYVNIKSSKATTITTEDSYFCDTSGNPINGTAENSKTLTVPANTSTKVYAPIAGGTYSVQDKYSLTELSSFYSTYYDLSMFKWCTEMVQILRYYGNLSDLANLSNLTVLRSPKPSGLDGDISVFADKTKMTYLDIGTNQRVTGNVSDLGALILLTRADIGDTGVGGTLESFVQAQRAARVAAGMSAGNSTGITMNYLHYTNITFDGEAVPTTFNSNCVLTWTDTTITLTSGANTKTVTA